jgi:hypothetical protein
VTPLDDRRKIGAGGGWVMGARVTCMCTRYPARAGANQLHAPLT